MNIRQLKSILGNFNDDFVIDFTFQRKLNEKELAQLSYPYPYINTSIQYSGHDASYSDKQLCIFLKEESDK